MLNFKRTFLIFFAAVLFVFVVPNIEPAFADGTRISDFKATTDPVSANPRNYSKTLTFTYTAQTGDPALENFKVECGTASGGSTTWGKTVREFKCSYPKDPATPHTVTLTPQDSSGKAIGDPATLQVQEKDPTPTPTPGGQPNDKLPYNDVISDGLSIKNPSNQTDVTGLATKLINWLLLIIAMVAGIMIIYSGLMLVFNGGDQARITKAKSTLQWAIVGLVVAIGAFALVNIIQSIF